MVNKEMEIKCSFCGRPESLVKQMVAGPNNLFICDECINSCYDMLKGKSEASEDFVLPTPHDIKAKLDEYIVGQNEAKKVLSVAVYNHYKRVMYNAKNNDSDEIDLKKSNILMLGPTGCGKTLLAQTLSRILNVPFAVADATTLTEAGYVGEDVENVLLKLIQAADYDIKKAEKGIIYIDEIDKIARKSENVSITRDVSGEGVQQALLKIVESTVASVPPQGGRKHPQQECLQIDTTNILFIFGGEIKKTDLSEEEILKKVQPQDLIKFGLIPEFIGRVPITVSLSALDEAALVNILTQPKDALVKQYIELMKMDGVDLSFEPDAVKAIAHKAIELKTGARGLRSIVEDCMLDTMFDAPTDKSVRKIIITKDSIINGTRPIIIKKEEKSA